MPVKVETIDGVAKKILVTEYRERKANAFRFGTMNGEPRGFQYTFEKEEYQRGIKSDATIRQQIKDGLR